LGRELSRLVCTDKDFCYLLEVCQIFGILIADDTQIYDFGLTDDFLVLGIKGTLSVVELKILKARLIDGQREKVRRGELFRLLPTGYVPMRAEMVKDRTRAEAMTLVFHSLRSCGPCARRSSGSTITGRLRSTSSSLGSWSQLPTQSASTSCAIRLPRLRHGQHPTETVLVEGRLPVRAMDAPPEERSLSTRSSRRLY
jgi:DNA invertase Pin-like site-specific DNA recombinase